MRATLLAGLLALVGCGKGKPTDDDRPSGGAVSDGSLSLGPELIPEFIDHTERFKGKTLRVVATVDSPIFASGNDTLKKYAGRDVRFSAYGQKREILTVAVRMPAGELPNAVFGDKLRVTFVCKDGSLQSGNEGLRVERP